MSEYEEPTTWYDGGAYPLQDAFFASSGKQVEKYSIKKKTFCLLEFCSQIFFKTLSLYLVMYVVIFLF